MAEWGYVVAGFALTALAVGVYALRLELRIARLRRRRDGRR